MMQSQSNQPAINVREDEPSISVVIPAYNAGRFINAAIDSVLQQTVPPLEIIVIDDGSTDDTCERLLIYGQQIRYYFQNNAGIGAARNTGICAADGDWIALLDADDIWHPRKLELQSSVIRRNPSVSLIGTVDFLIDKDGARLNDAHQMPIPYKVEQLALVRLLQSSVFCPSSAVLRKVYITANGGFALDVQGSEDMLMWWVFAASYSAFLLHAPLTGYRIHAQSISHNYSTMIAGKKRALKIAILTIPIMQSQRRLRCLARARVFREASWESYCNGNYSGAIADLLISIVSYPFALSSYNGVKLRCARAKLLCRYLLSAGHNWISQ